MELFLSNSLLIDTLNLKIAFKMLSQIGLILLFCSPYLPQATIPHINSETNPPPPIINGVCKYLRQFRDTSFGVATLPISCNIE